MSHSGRASADETLALAIASGQTIRAAAVLAGIGEATAHRRLATEAFRGRVKQLRADVIGLAVGKLGATMGDAADAMRELLKSGVETVRLSAAKGILELGAKLWTAVDQQKELERMMDEVKKLVEDQQGKTESW